MRREDTIQLNTHALVQRVQALGLKQWWLAQSVGVAAKTVNRWLAGSVQRVDRRNAVMLAECLGCELEEITVAEPTDVFATRAQQRRAADLIRERDLLGLLSPSDNWQLAEGVIKATMQPNLPLRDLGTLYNLLSVTSWRQGSYAEARQHAEQARRIGGRCGDQGIVHRAVLNLATIESIAGSPAAALAGYEATLAEPELFQTPRDHAAALSNISAVYFDFGRVQESLAAQRASIAMFGELGLPYNLAISWMSMAQILTAIGELDEAEPACDEAMRWCAESGFDRGEYSTMLYRADVRTLAGDHGAALELAASGLAGLARFAVYDLMCNQIGVRVARRAGLLALAGQRLAEALRAARPFPLIHARLLREGARLAYARGDGAECERAWRQAEEILTEIGLGCCCRGDLHGAAPPEYGQAEPVSAPAP